MADPDSGMDCCLRAQGALLDPDARDARRSVAPAPPVVGGRYSDGAQAHAPDVPLAALAAVARVVQLHPERAVGVHDPRRLPRLVPPLDAACTARQLPGLQPGRTGMG